MRQVAAAQVGHLEVDVAQVQAGQIGAAEVQTLKPKKTGESGHQRGGGADGSVPGSGALTLWAWPAGIAPAPSGRWASGPLGAASSAHNVQRVRRGPPPPGGVAAAKVTFIAASSCSASRSIPKKRASSSTPAGHSGQRCPAGNSAEPLVPTSEVHALVDDQLTVSQVVEDGLKVLGTAVDQVRPTLIPLVAPHVCNDGSQSDHRKPYPPPPPWNVGGGALRPPGLTRLPEHVSQHAIGLLANQRAPEGKTGSERVSTRRGWWRGGYLVVVKGRPPMFRVSQSVCEPH